MRNLSVTRRERLQGAGKAGTIALLPFQPILPFQPPSVRFSSSFTRFGFALPPAAFITCPTRKPNVVVLPPWYIATASAFFASTSAIKPARCDSSSICVRPSAATISSAVRPDANIFSNTSLAIDPLIVPCSTSAISPARRSGARRSRRRAVSYPSSFILARTTPSSQFLTAFASAPARTVSSKYRSRPGSTCVNVTTSADVRAYAPSAVASGRPAVPEASRRMCLKRAASTKTGGRSGSGKYR